MTRVVDQVRSILVIFSPQRQLSCFFCCDGQELPIGVTEIWEEKNGLGAEKFVFAYRLSSPYMLYECGVSMNSPFHTLDFYFFIKHKIRKLLYDILVIFLLRNSYTQLAN